MGLNGRLSMGHQPSDGEPQDKVTAAIMVAGEVATEKARKGLIFIGRCRFLIPRDSGKTCPEALFPAPIV
jgi:hypothetical protein